MGIPKGQARIEYLAHKTLIQASLDEGYTLVHIYQKLKAEGKLTLSYPRLAGLVANKKNKTLQKADSRKKIDNRNSKNTNTDTYPRIIEVKTNSVFKQKLTSEDLYKELID